MIFQDDFLQKNYIKKKDSKMIENANYEVIKFIDNEFELDVTVSLNEETIKLLLKKSDI